VPRVRLKLSVFGATVTDVGRTSLTVTTHAAVLPFFVVAVIVAVFGVTPGAAAGLTTPAALTVATEVSLDDHVTVLS
jgi:hypothetical protein